MTDRSLEGLYEELYPYSKPMDTHFFKCRFTVFNKLTEEYKAVCFYLCCKRNQKWLERCLLYRGKYPLPTEFFTYSWDIKEVEDSDDILFHHITTPESCSRITFEYFMSVCALGHWRKHYLKIWKEKLHKYIVGKYQEIFHPYTFKVQI